VSCFCKLLRSQIFCKNRKILQNSFNSEAEVVRNPDKRVIAKVLIARTVIATFALSDRCQLIDDWCKFF